MEHEEKNWKSINDLLSDSGRTLNVLEEEIDINVQRQYMALSKRLGNESTDYETLVQQARDDMNKLFDETVDDHAKQQLLVLLATIDDVAVYRAIESFAKQDTSLKMWATVALQQSRMLIQSMLMDEATVFVSTGLGGHGGSLRYFCVFIANAPEAPQPYQYDIIRKETEDALASHAGSIEEFELHGRYVTLTALLPLHANLKDIFKGIIVECNNYGHFLHEHMIITNVKKLSIEEIETFLRETKPENLADKNPEGDTPLNPASDS
jgi:hypothetical protein